MLVDFMIIGAQKCGTTTLFDILDSHPDLQGSEPKEPQFFSSSPNWREELPAYEKIFTKKERVQYFEGSTSYTFYPLKKLNIWEDLYAYNPDMKFIYIVRKPIDRIISGYMHNYERGYTDKGVNDAVKNDRLYVDITRYYTQIKPFIKQFGAPNIHIIDFDDLINNRAQVVKGVSSFLNIDMASFTSFEKTHSNVSVNGRKTHVKYDNPQFYQKVIRKFCPAVWNKITDNSNRRFSQKPELSLELKQMIVTVLELEIKQLEFLMDKDLSSWMTLN